MEQTTHYGLKKPDVNDYADVAVLNENAELLDTALHKLDEEKVGLDPKTGLLPTGAVTPKSIGATTEFTPVLLTFSASGWTGSGPWTQTVSVEGVTAGMENLTLSAVNMDNATVRTAYEKALGCLAPNGESVEGGITLTAYERPGIDIQLILKGVTT